MNKRVPIICIILVVLTIALQAVPRIFGDSFTFAVLLGGLPVYTAARLSCILGLTVYFTAAALSACMNFGEALFFACTNGVIGLSSGIMKNRFKNNCAIPASSSLLVIAMLFTVNYFLGIRIFGNSAVKAPVLQAIKLFLPLYIYCLAYLKLAIFTDNLLRRSFDLNKY